jgi:Fe2+ or Zn2+ uptake regulation protein
MKLDIYKANIYRLIKCLTKINLIKKNNLQTDFRSYKQANRKIFFNINLTLSK